jgi:hypothetical protein
VATWKAERYDTAEELRLERDSSVNGYSEEVRRWTNFATTHIRTYQTTLHFTK